MKTIFALLMAMTAVASAGNARFIEKLKRGEKVTIVTLGTSLTTKWPAVVKQSWLDKDFPGLVTLHNLGVGASASSFPAGKCGLDTVKKAVTLKPDVVFIEFAINDAFAKYNISLEDSKKNLNTIIDQLAGAEVILMTMNPVKDEATRPKLADYYQGYRDVAKQRGLLIVDNYPNWKREPYPADGVHPTDEAYQRVLLPELKRALGVP